MIGFFIGCIVLGIVLAGVLAPVVMVANRQRVKRMQDIVDEWQGLPDRNEPGIKRTYRKRLYTEKRHIIGDKSAIEEARDIIDRFERD